MKENLKDLRLPNVITVTQIGKRLKLPVPKILYGINKARIKPVCKFGSTNVYHVDDIRLITETLKKVRRGAKDSWEA